MPEITAVITATHSATFPRKKNLLQVVLSENQQQDGRDLRRHLELAER